MAEDIKASLCKLLMTTKFSLQVDESILPNNEALLAYVQFLKESRIIYEMLFARGLIVDSKRSIFSIVSKNILIRRYSS